MLSEPVAVGEDRMKLELSPIHRAVWHPETLELFSVDVPPMPPEVRARLSRSLDIVRQRRRDGTLYDVHGVVDDAVLAELAAAGYFGLRVDPRYGGAGATYASLVAAMTEMAIVDPWVAGLLTAQAGLGPVSSLTDFGTDEQKARLLPPLARGERLGCFAVTEPGTSSDWGQIATTARRDGDRILVTGEKLFITNAGPGRTITILCRVEGRHEALVIELPWREDEHFHTVTYALRAPAHLRNVGVSFKDLPVPAANLLVPRKGDDGAAIARRALNHGRVAVCALAAGVLRRFAGTLIPWVQQRQTFGAAIGTRELVERRLGRLAARIVACDALAAWGATLLDQGYRGELECVTVKVVGSEMLKEAAVDVLLKTLGARAFLGGNDFADGIHDLLAPTIYEGENEILTLGFLSSLGKAHGATLLAPMAAAVRAAGFAHPDLANPRHAWAARRELASYVGWLARREAQHLGGLTTRTVPDEHAGLTALAGHVLCGAALEISRLGRSGPDATARQALVHQIATRVQHATTLLVVNRYAASHEEPLVRTAGLCMAMELGHALLGARPSVRYLRHLTELGAAVADDRFTPVASAERGEIRMAEHLPAPEPEEAAGQRPILH